MPKKKERSLLDLLTQVGKEAEPQERDLSESPKRKPPRQISQTPVMQLELLEIKNLWCYELAEISFDEGITVIAGPNGSGKSSLLESIFFALYGSKAGPAMERSLADLLRIGADAGSVQLKFQYGSQRYTAQMALRRRGESVISEKEDCRLTREDGEKWVGVENVAQAVEELFGMNRDDFTNCVYVRQGEIDRLIRAGEEERRGMIDRLLRLEKLDRYAQRVREGARRALHRRLDVLRHLARDFQKQIEELETKNPAKGLLESEEKLQAKQSELKALEEKISQAEKFQHGLQEKLRRLEEITREIEERSGEILKKEKQFQQYAAKEQQLRSELEDLKKNYKQLEGQLAKGLTELKLDKEQIIRSLSKVSSPEEVDLLSQEFAQTKSRQETLHAQIGESQTELNKQLDGLSSERAALVKAIAQHEAKEQQLQRELEEMRSLIRQGKCPVCKQSVDGETFAPTLNEKQSVLQKIAAEGATQRKKLQRLESNIDALKREGERVLKQLNDEFRVLDARRNRLEELKELTLLMLRTKEQGQEKRDVLRQTIEAMEMLREEISRLKDKIAELKNKLGDPSELQGKLQKAGELLRQLAAQKEELQKQAEALIHERGVLKNQLEQLEKFRQSHAETEEELKKIEQLLAELEQLRESYEALKKELRSKNIRAIEFYFNQLFQLMDSGASYRRVRINEEYEILVELKNGSTIRPELLSGGERALINIALRAAIHQVLSQATSRMPLIFDEPTIYLDRDRVNRLQFLLEELGGRIGQVIVVSHELGLVEGADHEYRTEKTSDNTSRVYRVR